MNILGMVFIGGAYIIYLYIKYYFTYLPSNFLDQSKNYLIERNKKKSGIIKDL